MKKILHGIIVILLMVSLILPFAPEVLNSGVIGDNAMGLIYGGQEKIDCGALALIVEAGCYALGGGWFGCALVTGGAYLGCLAANSLAG